MPIISLQNVNGFAADGKLDMSLDEDVLPKSSQRMKKQIRQKLPPPQPLLHVPMATPSPSGYGIAPWQWMQMHWMSLHRMPPQPMHPSPSGHLRVNMNTNRGKQYPCASMKTCGYVKRQIQLIHI